MFTKTYLKKKAILHHLSNDYCGGLVIQIYVYFDRKLNQCLVKDMTPPNDPLYTNTPS